MKLKNIIAILFLLVLTFQSAYAGHHPAPVSESDSGNSFWIGVIIVGVVIGVLFFVERKSKK